MARQYFHAYFSYLENMKRLTDAEAGRLFRALLTYSQTGVLEELPGNERFVVDGMVAQIDRDNRRYEEKCEANRRNGALGGRASSDRKQTPPKEKEKEKETEKEMKKETSIEADASCAEPEAASTPPVITLPLNDGGEYPVTAEQYQEWAGLYPGVDILQQLRGMRGWLLANPVRKKTRRGIGKFINGWLSKEQDRGSRAVSQVIGARGDLGEAELDAIRQVMAKSC